MPVVFPCLRVYISTRFAYDVPLVSVYLYVVVRYVIVSTILCRLMKILYYSKTLHYSTFLSNIRLGLNLRFEIRLSIK